VIRVMRLEYPIRILCRVLKVSRSRYYEWAKMKVSKRSQENERLKIAIAAEHRASGETYGPLRLKDELKEKGFKVSVGRIIRLRKEMGIRCRQKKKYRATTDSNHGHPVYENLLGECKPATGPNQIWVSDITYIWTDEGWLYLAGILDAFQSELVGYSFSDRIKKEIVINALARAVIRKRPGKGVLHHSDRGSQYCSREYRRKLKRYGMIGSMSRKGNCYDNAMMESFWAILKTEFIYGRRFRTRAEAIALITSFIETKYNRQRRHSRLGNLSPAAFLQNYFKNLSQAA